MNHQTQESRAVAGAQPLVGHLVPWQILLATCLALLVLTVITVLAIRVDLGPLNLWIAMTIAAVKASLVVMYFMHLRWDRPFNVVAFLASIVFLTLFISLAMLDSVAYKGEMIPPTAKEYAPIITRTK
ncbi:MAG: cytochrome C oxidase subunit IV family protein [Planctomycetes bacterium]|nr:cytochrome C oxidase subunit IV family protein [Planctomycetota bacterium]